MYLNLPGWYLLASVKFSSSLEATWVWHNTTELHGNSIPFFNVVVDFSVNLAIWEAVGYILKLSLTQAFKYGRFWRLSGPKLVTMLSNSCLSLLWTLWSRLINHKVYSNEFPTVSTPARKREKKSFPKTVLPCFLKGKGGIFPSNQKPQFYNCLTKSSIAETNNVFTASSTFDQINNVT